MEVISNIDDLRKILRDYRKQNPDNSVGFVPTMGYLHNGHSSLIRMSSDKCQLTVASIFVNPLQFNDPEDYSKYPRNPEQDLETCRESGADLVFLPNKEQMLGKDDPMVQISVPSMTTILCGPGRPGHFEGVLFIVSRLFNIVQPDCAYFGKKDFQQLRIIQQLVKDLAFPVEVVGGETLREDDGLAMSSRNARLTPVARTEASLLYRALKLGCKSMHDGNREIKILTDIIQDIIHSGVRNKVEYVEFVNAVTLEKYSDVLPDDTLVVIASAIECAGVRLIDNIECQL